MDFKKFIVIPILVAFLAFTFIVLDQLLSPYMPIPGNKGFGWVTFQAWALYFLAGCTLKGGFKTIMGYLVGVIMTILIIELAGLSVGLGFYAFPAAAFVVVIGAISMEKVPPLDFIPAIFVGSAVMVCFMSYIHGATYASATLTIMTYCIIGILYGMITVKLRTAYERKVA